MLRGCVLDRQWRRSGRGSPFGAQPCPRAICIGPAWPRRR